ncbi:MAG: ZIP family metal transporter [Defluviitaleaceae bacterium]|nr:ZIP family metal transporter [Defluviitaleaceae bacterium]
MFWYNWPTLLQVIAFAVMAGLLGTTLGGVITILLPKLNRSLIGVLFSFSAAVLIALVFVDLLPHAIGHGHYHFGIDDYGRPYQYWFQHSGAGLWLTVLGIAIGVGFILLLDKFDKHGHEHVHGILPHNEHCSHKDLEVLGMSERDRKRMFRAAFSIAFAIILHDFPKGFAIGASGSAIVALAIGVAHIPEGMTIAIPLKATGAKWHKIIGICSLAGLATLLGAVSGYFLGGLGPYVSGIMFAVAAGCVIGVVFKEIIPLSTQYVSNIKWKMAAIVLGIALVVILNYYFHGYTHM